MTAQTHKYEEKETNLVQLWTPVFSQTSAQLYFRSFRYFFLEMRGTLHTDTKQMCGPKCGLHGQYTILEH